MTATPLDAEESAALYREHADELIRYATVLVGRDDASDIVTDAVLNACASPNWHVITNRRAYLFRSVLNQANSMHRSTGRRQRREDLAARRTAAWGTAPETSIDAQTALQQLSAQQRTVVYLTYWEDQTPADIAELLDTSEGTVRKQLARGREQLRKVMSS